MDANKTEQPTPQRRKKARDQGQVARSRELSSALAWACVLGLVAWQAPQVVRQWRGLLQSTLDVSAREPLRSTGPVFMLNAVAVLRWTAPVILGAWALALGAGVAQGGLIFAPEALAPKIERLSPSGKLSQMFSLTGLSGILKSLLPFGVILWIGISTVSKHIGEIATASELGLGTTTVLLANLIWALCWKSGLVLLAWAGVDYFLVRQKLEGDLKMSRQELRDEAKDTEANPLIKGRIRRIQRQMRRRQMLRDTAKASVVITNPTHFAVALQYEMDMEAPTVVAKGRDLLAQQIKEVARWHGIAIMENPPLAQALFRTVEVGQAIPAKLYTAVAEILAFVFRAQAQARQQASAR